MQFEPTKHYTRKTRLEDCRVSYDLHIGLSHFICTADGRLSSIFKLSCGPVDVQIDITPAQCREFAAHLLAHADEFEARWAEHDALNLEAA